MAKGTQGMRRAPHDGAHRAKSMKSQAPHARQNQAKSRGSSSPHARQQDSCTNC